MTDTVVLLHEDFGGHPQNWDTVQSSDFYASNGQAVTNGHNDGAMEFDAVDMSGLTNGKITLDASACGDFEEWGTHYGDMLRIELVDQDGNVHLLDMFTGNGHTLTGSETGQQIDGSLSKLEFDIPEGLESFQLRITSDISANCETIKLDNVKITADNAPPPADDCEVVLLHEDFSGYVHDWGSVQNSDFYAHSGQAVTNGCHDGKMVFDTVNMDGLSHGKLTLDASACGSFEKWGHHAGDRIRIELIDEHGNVILLDQFTGWGHTLTGNKTGQKIDASMSGLEYDIPEGLSSFTLRIKSDISAYCEYIKLDNVKITAYCPPQIEVAAVDDSIRVAETEGAGDLETLEDGSSSILDNDTADGEPYEGAVVTVNGVAGNVGQFIDLADGGRVKINADGTVDFDADGDFDALNDGESDVVTVNYSIAAESEGEKFDGKLKYDFWNHVPAHHSIHYIPSSGGEYTGTVDDLDVNALALSLTGDPNTYKIRYSGYLHIEEAGHYNFKIGGDDGVGIWIDGHQVATRDGLHGFEYANGTIDLSSGAHHVEIRFFENYGDQGLDVQIKGADTGGVHDHILDYVNSTNDFSKVSATDTATVKIIIDGENDEPEIDALDDAITVFETEGAGDLETLESGDDSILDNDVEDGQAYTGDVITVNGTAANVGQFVDLAGGGRVRINEDGTVDFDADGDFDALNDGESDVVTVNYSIGSESTIAAKTNLLFVVDASGSTLSNGLPEGVFQGAGVGDVNGDGRADTPLDAEIAAVKSAIADLLASGVDPSTVTVGLVSFNTDAQILGTFALDDPSLINALNGIQGDVNGWTDYDHALDKSIDWFNTRPADGAENKVVFLSDGVPRVPNGTIQNNSVYGPEVATLTNTAGINAEIEAIGVGGNAELEYLDDLDNTGGAVRVTDAATLTTMVSDAAQVVGTSDEATVTITILGENDAPELNAEDDCFTVLEDETFGDLEQLPGDIASILANDTADGQPYSGQVVLVDGQAANIGQFVQLAGGGRIKINADGTVDFDADGDQDGISDFEALGNGDSAMVSISYTIGAAGGDSVGPDRVLDFNDLAVKTDISDAIDGVTITAVRRNELGDGNPENAARIYDTSVNGRDNDLQASASGPLSKVLIIQEDNGSDIRPDDNYNGGTVRFDFDTAQTVRSVDLIDTEESNGVQPSITFTFADGTTETIQAAVTGNQDATTQVFNGNQGVANVVAMEFEFIGSAGIDNLVIAEQ
ncbi:MAG: Ig-like domain-containing protein, partial [Paracoccaceae bacterium]